jgi:hypothetical protein
MNRIFYVKLDNVHRSEQKRHHVVYALSGRELLEKTKRLFDWKDTTFFHLELWSSCLISPIRLDIVDIIPDEYEFIKARVVQSSSS